MGVAFANGNGVGIDYVEAYKWYLLEQKGTSDTDPEGRRLISENINRVVAKPFSDEKFEA
jgi:hypothetical protein